MNNAINKYVLDQLSWNQLLLIACLIYSLRFIEWGIKTLWAKWRNSKKPNSHDLELWQTIKGIEIEVDFWRGRFIAGGSFSDQKQNALDEFVGRFRYPKPHMKFLDNKLETLKNLLVEKADRFRRTIAENTQEGRNGRLSFARDRFGDSFDDVTSQSISDIDSIADDFVKAFDALHKQVIETLTNKKLLS